MIPRCRLIYAVQVDAARRDYLWAVGSLLILLAIICHALGEVL